MSAAVEYADVGKRFGKKVVLDGFSLSVETGETLVLLGRSGSGKSVSLKLLLGLVRADRGEIRVLGQEVSRLPERQLHPVRRRVGMVFQGGALFDSLTVAENVAYGLREHRALPEADIPARVAECLSLVDLDHVEHLLPDALSGGMKKRVAVARAVATHPELLLYDEPTTGLDPATAGHVNRLIRSMQAKLGVTSIVVTHDMESAFMVGDRLALLERGHLAWAGTPDEARDGEQLPDPLARFLGRTPGTYHDEEEEQSPWTPPAASP